jgi:lipoprotein-releasing system ATP-binding protein
MGKEIRMTPTALTAEPNAARTASRRQLLHSLQAVEAPRPAAAKPAASPASPLITATGLFKSYRKGKHIIPVLKGVDFSIRPGEFVAIVGQSGSGKSTLLHLLGTLDEPDAGEIQFEGNRIDNLPQQARDVLRNKYFGMIFQFYHLLPELSTLENVLVPKMIGEGILRYWWNRREHARQATQLLELVGLGHRLTHKPKELSGGEMQRAAIARALVASPQLLLADEPTGNLDRQTGADIMRLLRSLNREQNLTIIMVTHDSTIAGMADRTVRLVEGLVERVA